MNRVQRIRRDLPGRRTEISSMDKQSISFPLYISRRPFSFFSPPSLICCSRGLESEQTSGSCCVMQIRRGKASSSLVRMYLGNTRKDLFAEDYREEHGWTIAFTEYCSFANLC